MMPSDMGAVAEMAMFEPATRYVEPVQGLRTQHIVMVVDDFADRASCDSTRLLTREGYQVVLARGRRRCLAALAIDYA